MVLVAHGMVLLVLILVLHFTTEATCTPSTKCLVKSPYSCADNVNAGIPNCEAKNDATKCTAVSTFCSAVTEKICVKNDTYCTSKDANTCIDTTNCTANLNIGSCPNKETK